MIRMEDAGWLKRRLFQWAWRGAPLRRRHPRQAAGATLDRLRYAGQALIYGPLRNVLGMSRIRVAYTAGGDRPGPVPLLPLDRHQPQAVLRPDRNLRLRLPAAGRPGQVRYGGPAAPGMEIRIADNGEVLVRGVGLLKNYYKRPTPPPRRSTPRATS
jgi:long-chain acyl-CoA synthetase